MRSGDAVRRAVQARRLGWLCMGVLALGLLFAALSHLARAAAPVPILPNLVADPPTGAELTTDSSTGTAQLLLRFDGYVHNAGPGALDFRGSREAPQVSRHTIEEVERAAEYETGLPQKTEEELAVPPMHVFQRLFTTNGEQTNIERPHIDEPSTGEMVYVSADGHHHWHLQRVASYSLWNAAKSAETAPSQKVGFCLVDSEHVEPAVGPGNPVYSDRVAPFQNFCERYRPTATKLYEGISPGWRDRYPSSVAFQWVNVSNVLPGEYWLREDVNPLGVIKEASAAKAPAYAGTATIIPGFDALAQATTTPSDQAKTVTLAAASFADSTTPTYKILSDPSHGTLGTLNGDQVTYTPAPGYAGPDSFTFSAADASSQFPEHPALATVAIAVGEVPPQPGIVIATAPASVTAGASAALSAAVSDYIGEVEWQVSGGGTISAEGPGGLDATFKAPPTEGAVTVTARLAGDPAVSATRTIAVQPLPPDPPAQELPPEKEVPKLPPDQSRGGTPPAPTVTIVTTTPSQGAAAGGGVEEVKATHTPALSRPRAMLFGRELVASTVAELAGRVRLSAYVGARRLGTCVARTPAGRRFTCRLTLRSVDTARERITIVASLRAGRELVTVALKAARLPRMTMRPAGDLQGSARAATYGAGFWCGPSTLIATLGGGEES